MPRKKPDSSFRTGYSKASFLINTITNVTLSTLLVISSLPLLLFVGLVLRLKEGGPVFYRGVRLGMNKKPFVMYKFRTLVPGAESIMGAELLSRRLASEKRLVTDFGKFLRDTRLDELPQLFNILRGDMDFLGPRPERPAIYERFCQHIKGYEKRFDVKPGLIGYSQLFTPHSTPKRIRTLIDNRFIKKKQNVVWDIGVILYTGMVLLRNIGHSTWHYIVERVFKSRILHRYEEKRHLDRVRLRESEVRIRKKPGDGADVIARGRIIDINEEAVLIHCNEDLGDGDLELVMQTEYRRPFGPKRRKRKSAVCTGTIHKKFMLVDQPYASAYVIKYVPVSPLNYYFVHQYFLQESMI
jgi:lipopolysaccharide/colanic/teichoic acid biosynthesis glycosyltransferase